MHSSVYHCSSLHLGIAQQNAPRNADSLRAVRAAQSAAAYKKYQEKVFTHADTLRGSITPERAWWDVLRYDINREAGLC